MADLTTDQIQTAISSTLSAYTTAIASPKPNYSIGGRTVNYADYLKMLLDNLQLLRTMKAESVSGSSEAVVDFDSDITNTGEDNTEYEGDDNV